MSEASVEVEGSIVSKISNGLLILLAVAQNDVETDVEWLTKKIVSLRIFADSDGLMNRSVQETGAEIMLISQFTLLASTKKGRRPSFIQSAKPEIAKPIFEKVTQRLDHLNSKPTATGIFGADMKVQLVNDGPVTIIIDSKNKE